MILDALLQVFLVPLNFFVDLIPTVDFIPENVGNNLVSLIANVSCFMPVTTFFIAIGIWFILANIDFTIAALHWIIRKIPGVD